MSVGFIVGDGTYAAIPCGKKGKELMVICNGHQLQICKTEASARKFIKQHSASPETGTVFVNEK